MMLILVTGFYFYSLLAGVSGELFYFLRQKPNHHQTLKFVSAR
jgi:hypothetical protein